MNDEKCLTLLHLLRHRAKHTPERHAYTYLLDGEIEETRLTYAEFDLQARIIAANLQRVTKRGRRALMLYPPGLAFLPAFFGCFYAGVIAVPVYPPRNARHMPRLHIIAREADTDLVLTTADISPKIQSWAAQSEVFEKVRFLATDDLDPAGAEDWHDPALRPDDIALLQYTSGSTSTPKGVMISQGNLMHNLACIQRSFGLSEESLSISWMPHFHDMGLIEGQLEPLFSGFPAYLMAAAAFIQSPYRWLKAISHYRATHSAGPNFAFELCIRKITPEQRETLDLSCWKTTLNGAEPVRAATVERFAETFAPCGFNPSGHRPGYGLAEATLLMASTGKAVPPAIEAVQSAALEQDEIVFSEKGGEGGRKLVGCGPAVDGMRIAIVDPDQDIEVPAGRVGEIWISGPSIARGYWRQPDATRETFQAYLRDTGEGPFLRTGDLGFLRGDGSLFVTGRLKDVIIVAGANHYPQDIEFTVENSHPALQPDAGAAVAIEEDDEERLVIVQEVKRSHRREIDPAEVFAAVSAAVAQEHELQVERLLLLSPASIPKTSSGKIQRSACRKGVLSGELKVLEQWSRCQGLTSPAPQEKRGMIETGRDRTLIRDWIRARIAERLGIAPDSLSTKRPLAEYGLVSRDAVGLTGELEAYLGLRLSPTLVFRHPTIDALAGALAGFGSDTADLPHILAPALDRAEPVAIIGLGCRFPGAEGPAAFWDLLEGGVDAITEVPADRWKIPADSENGARIRWGGFITGPGDFDADFFGIARREAEAMDPQQRLLLEVAWEALENAGLRVERLAGSRTGVFVGISTEDYARLQSEQGISPDAYRGTGTAFSIAANRLSYFFDLRGPSLAVDTACSSSLVALHEACRSLHTGEADLALAAGVNIILSPELALVFSRARMMAADGRCKSFDGEADGYVRGEGCGVVVLKPLSRAVADGDRVWAVIRGSSVNQDGRSNGLTAPNGGAQQAVLREALARAGTSPRDIDFVETHGTGTPLGDPIEVEALEAVLGAGRPPEARLPIGSVKTNIGHLEAAAGIAGLIKAALALAHRRLPASLHLRRPNPHIAWDDIGLRVATRSEPLENTRPLRAGVSSFGFGGTNAHVVLEEAPGPEETPVETASPFLIPFSAADGRSLAARIEAFRDGVLRADASTPAMEDIAHTLGRRTSHLECRRTFVARDREQLMGRISEALRDPVTLETVPALRGRRPRLAMVFPDQGNGWAETARMLMKGQPVFRDRLEELDRSIDREAGWHILEILASEGSNPRLLQPEFEQPVTFAVQTALAALWRHWGILPDGVVGCGSGEVAAALIAGALDPDQAVRVIVHRGRGMEQAAGQEGRPTLTDLTPQEPTLPFYSTVTGSTGKPPRPDRLGPEYWVRNMREPVRFREAALAMIADGFDTFLEIGPCSSFSLALRECVQEQGGRGRVLGPGPEFRSGRRSGLEDLLETLGTLYTLGAPVNWEAIAPSGRLLPLPAYPWQRQRFWFRAEEEKPQRRDPEDLWQGALAAADRQSRSGPFDLALHTYPAKWDALERLSRAYMVDGLKRLGAFESPGERRTADTLAERCGIKPDYRVLVGRWLDALANHGLLERDGHDFLSRAPLPEAGLAPLREEVQQILADIPFLADYLNRCGRLLPEVLTGRVNALETLFPDASLVTAEQLYHGWSVARYFNDIVTAALSAWIAAQPGGSPLRILEIGAGTGGLSRALIPDLPPERCEYTFTDVSEFFFNRMKERLKDYPFVRYALLDIEKEPGRQGFEAHGYDVVIAANVLHATLDLEQTLKNVRSLLAEGGLLLLYEVTQPLPWLDISVALIEGWQRFNDGLRKDCPLLSPEGWSSLLEQTGFISPAVFPGEHSRAAILGQSVIAARAPLHAPAPSRAAQAKAVERPASGGDDWLYELVWEPRPVDVPIGPGSTGKVSTRESSTVEELTGTWLIFADQSGVGKALARELRQRGARPLFVSPGVVCTRRGEDHVEVRPDRPEDLHTLLEGRQDQEIAGVVHLWSLDAPPSDSLDPEGLDRSSLLGVESVLHLLHALNGGGGTPSPRTWFVTREAQAIGRSHEEVAVSQSPLWGLARVIANELPQSFGALVDLDGDEAPGASAGHLLREIAGPASDQIAYRGGIRYVARLRHHRAGSSRAGLPISPKDTYLITGGLGVLGLPMAARLVDLGAQHLVLMGRTPLPPRTEWDRDDHDPEMVRRITGVRALEAQGVAVHCVTGDVADPRALEAALTEAGNKGAGPIRGVIHGAGILDARAVDALTPGELREMLHAKVMGAWALHRYFLHASLDFFMLFGSASSLLAPPGHGAYASANAFLDALAHYRRGKGLPAVAVSWGVWEDAGATARPVVDRFKRDEMERIDFKTGLSLAQRLALGDSTHVAVLPGGVADWIRFIPELSGLPLLKDLFTDGASPPAGKPSPAAPLPGFGTEDSMKGLVERLREEAAGVLKEDPNRLSIERSLLDMGMDSLMAVDLKNRIETALGVEIPVAKLLEGPGIRETAEYIVDQLAKEASSESAMKEPDEREILEI